MKPYWTPSRMPRPTPSVVVTAPPTNGRHPTFRPHPLNNKDDYSAPINSNQSLTQQHLWCWWCKFGGVAYILTYQKSPPTPLRPLFSYKKQTSSLVCGWPGELHRPTSWLHLPRLPPSAGPAVPTAAKAERQLSHSALQTPPTFHVIRVTQPHPITAKVWPQGARKYLHPARLRVRPPVGQISPAPEVIFIDSSLSSQQVYVWGHSYRSIYYVWCKPMPDYNDTAQAFER